MACTEWNHEEGPACSDANQQGHFGLGIRDKAEAWKYWLAEMDCTGLCRLVTGFQKQGEADCSRLLRVLGNGQLPAQQNELTRGG